MELPLGRERYAGFGVDIRVREVADHFFSVVLDERYVDNGRLSAEFDVFDLERGGTGLCTSEVV